ncbi:unnamed protein product [Urochloa humidicola]
MAQSMDDMAKKLDGLEDLLKKMADKLDESSSRLHRLETAPPPPPSPEIQQVLDKLDATSARIRRLENMPPPPPPPPPQRPEKTLPQPPSHWVRTIDLNMAPQQETRPSASTWERPSGHRIDSSYRDVGGGILGSSPPHPVTGMPPDPSVRTSEIPDSSGGVNRSFHKPKMEFPKFDGTNPRLWKDKCESYFEIYSVSEHLKHRFAALNFEKTAETWFQTIELKSRFTSWEELHTAVCARFDKDQYQLCLKQLDNLKQTSSVADYHSQFEQLAHNILLYNSNYNDTYLVVRFLNGLRDDIRAPIALHRPKDVDTAASLALLQEEEVESQKRNSPPKSEHKDPLKTSSKVFTADEKIRTSYKKEDGKKKEKSTGESKWNSLLAFRKAHGLCFTCGEKWTGKAHKCPDQVPIHVVQELIESLQQDFTSDTDSSDDESAGEICVMAPAGADPLKMKRKRKTMRFRGFVGKKEITILLDSGSVGTFISPDVADQLSPQVKSCESLHFATANGAPMVSDSYIPQFQWLIQGHSFTYDARVLPLKCFDMIIGADWLEDHSPTWIHWKKKHMKFPLKGKRVVLHGLKDNISSCKQISGRKLKGLLRHKAVSHLVELKHIPSKAQHTDINALTAQAPASVPAEIQKVVQQFDSLFKEPSALPPPRQDDHHIPLIPGAQPVNVRPYRYSPQQKTEIEKQIKEMLRTGVIQHSSSPFASPVLLVKKKDGTWRFCIDYRHLNAITVKNKHPLPIVDELLDELAGAKWFTKLDFRSGYHQIRLAPGDEAKTAFRTHSGLYEFRVMPFGLTNAPTSFQGIMNKIFEPLLRRCVLVFMDDILIYSPTLEAHVEHLQQVFSIIQQHQFLVKKSKCTFGQQKLEYLGHLISVEGVATEPSKITAVLQWPTPVNIKQLRGFLGLTGYYRRFIRHYAMISSPLTKLLKKGEQFQWTQLQQDAFEVLKQTLCQAPILAVPDFQKPFVIETDASDNGLGAVLMQDGHPISYLSKPLCERNKALSTYEKECMAVLLAVEKWRAYLIHQEFLIRTDHRSLSFLSDQKATTKLQHKALLKLMDLKFKIQYKKGVTNQAADALSRYPQSESESVMAISVSSPTWMDKLQSGYEDDPEAQRLLTELSILSPNDKGYALSDGLIRYKGRVWVGNNKLAQQHILQALHSSGLGGHSGILATYQRVKSLFAWPKLKLSVQEYVKSCTICQQAKLEHVKLPGLLQPLPVPDRAWKIVCLDFIEGLPKSQGYDCILVVIDKFTKYAHFLPLAHPYTAFSVAQLYFNNIYKLHGLPEALISDRDRVFTSALWQELFKLTETSLLMSSSYHPQTDGQTERLNQCLEAFLRCTVSSCPKQWSKWISLAEFWYNTSYHLALGRSPFEVLYGHPPRHLGITNPQDVVVPDLDAWLTERNLITQLIQQQLLRAQHRMKHQADTHRSEREFAVGDFVYLKLQPHIQSSVATRSNHKLSFRFYGPFQIIQRVGAVAYKLMLPDHAQIHPVVHVSQLKKHVPPNITVSDDLSSVCTDPSLQVMPIAVLDTALKQNGGSTATRVLVQWNVPSQMQTWEDVQDLHRRFPTASAWGQADFQGGRTVTTRKGAKREFRLRQRQAGKLQ